MKSESHGVKLKSGGLVGGRKVDDTVFKTISGMAKLPVRDLICNQKTSSQFLLLQDLWQRNVRHHHPLAT